MTDHNAAHLQRIGRDPEFRALVWRRSRLAWLLSGIMTAAYFGFVLLVAFAPDLLGRAIGSGVTTLGIPLGLMVIAAAFALTGLYVWRANTEFDTVIERIVDRHKS